MIRTMNKTYTVRSNCEIREASQENEQATRYARRMKTKSIIKGYTILTIPLNIYMNIPTIIIMKSIVMTNIDMRE